MKKIKMIISIVVVIVVAFLYSHIAKMNMIYDKNVDNSDYLSMGEINQMKVTQSFMCREETLDGVYIKCQTLGDVSQTTVKYTVSEIDNGKILSKGNCKASDLKSTKFNRFMFDTIDKCKGKNLLLTVWSESDADSNGVTFYFQPSTEIGTKLSLNSDNINGTMIMKTITNRFDVETFCVLLMFILFIVSFIKILYKLFA